MNKKETRNTLYRRGGSIGIIGAARMGLVVEKHPDDPEKRVLAVNKVILARKGKSLTYTITTADNKAARVVWSAATNLSADNILSPDADSTLEMSSTVV